MTTTSVAAERKARKTAAPANGDGRLALIMSPVFVDTSAIRRLLEQQGISPFTADELDLPGRPVAEIVREAVERADLVVAILGNGATNDNVLFELGFAQALNKRTLLIVGEDSALPFAAASGLPYLRTSPGNARAIQYGLSQFVAAPHPGKVSPEAAVVRTHPLGAAVDPLLGRLRNESGALTNASLLEIVAEAIRLSGVRALSGQQSDGARATLAVWSEDLEPWVSNPLLIETKASISTAAQATRLFDLLNTALPAMRVSWALLVYLDVKQQVLSKVDRGPILAISAERFLESLRHTSFGGLIRNLRNARAHGRP